MMKATGIVRRIDDLGRVVIPKEIRRTMKIREGEPMEIFTDVGGSVIFRKYSPAGEQSALANNLCDAMYKTCARPFVICDRDTVIAASAGVRRELDGKPVSAALDAAMQARQIKKEPDSLSISDGVSAETAVIAPVIAGGDLCGCVAFLRGESPVSDAEVKLTQAAALLFARQMED
ncbi:MAG: stage V sporulation T C-terminal domain-containing protein [Clostridiaceae bacterium]|nr:stage V sporulation T C-terminal domain-containing protein [Clostridiaceae bacterium]